MNSRYDGHHGWKLSTLFENTLKILAQKGAGFRDTKMGSKEKGMMLMKFANARRDMTYRKQKIEVM